MKLKQTDRQTVGANSINSHANAVGNKIKIRKNTKIYSIPTLTQKLNIMPYSERN